MSPDKTTETPQPQRWDAAVALSAEHSMRDLADKLAFHAPTTEDLIQFVLRVDEQVADEQWTRDLIGKLLLALEGEGALFAGVFDFLRWLMRMDDPLDEMGCRDRQVVTLNRIIERAREVHAQLSEDLPGGDR